MTPSRVFKLIFARIRCSSHSLFFGTVGALAYSGLSVRRARINRYIDGCSVAIVTPSSSLQGRGLGELIDDHDVVIKFNRMVDWADWAQEDYGARCDILVHGLLEGFEPGYCGPIRPKSWMSRFPNLLVFYPFFLGWETYRAMGLYFLRGGDPVKTLVIDRRAYKEVQQMIGAKPTSGLVAAFTSVKATAHRISLFGLDFFSEPHNSAYFGHEVTSLDATRFGHAPEAEREFSNRFLVGDARVEHF